MNDGIVSLVLYTIFIFIFIGGWLGRDIAEARWREVTILLILLLLLLSPLIQFSFLNFEFSILAFILPILSGSLLIHLSEKERFQSILNGLIIAFLYNILIWLFSLDPILMIFEERLLIGLILGLLLGLLHFSLHIKWLISTLGLWLGLLYFYFNHMSHFKKLTLFSYYELDLLFTLYLCTAWVHYVYNLIYVFVRKKSNYHLKSKKA